MARTKKTLTPIDAAVADVLAAAVDQAGLKRRELAELTGMSANRIGIILRKEPPSATVGEIGALARAVSLSASDVIEQAEERVAPDVLDNVIELRQRATDSASSSTAPFEVDELRGVAYDQSEGEVGDVEEP